MLFFLAYDGEDAVRESLKAKVESGEVDLIIAAGTWPARVAIEFSDKVPVVAYPLGDAVTSGIVKAYDYSGIPNVWAQTDPTKYQRQMRVFHEVYNFTDTGTVFYDEAISGYKDYKASCDELGINFRTVRVDPLPSNPTDADLEAFNNNFLSAKSGMATLIPIAAACIADAVLILLFLRERKSDALVQK